MPAMVAPVNTQYWRTEFDPALLDTGSLNRILIVLITAAAVGVLLILVARNRRRDGIPRCPSCHHDLRGSEELPETCRECGFAIDERSVRRRLVPANLGWRRALDRTGFAMVILFLSLAALIGFLHPDRFRYTPTAFLVNVDAAWAMNLPDIDRNPAGLQRRMAGGFFREVLDRGVDGGLPDHGLASLSSRLLVRDTVNTDRRSPEIEIMRVAAMSGLVPIDRLATSPLLRPKFSTHAEVPSTLPASMSGQGSADPKFDKGSTAVIDIFDKIQCDLGNLETFARLRDYKDFSIEAQVRSITIGDRRFDIPVRRFRILNWPMGWGNLFTLRLEAPEDMDFPTGRHEISWDVEMTLNWDSAPGGKQVLRQETVTRKFPRPIDLLAPPPVVDDQESCDRIAAELARSAVLEVDPVSGRGMLVLVTEKTMMLELGTPTVHLDIEFPGGSSTQMQLAWPSPARDEPWSEGWTDAAPFDKLKIDRSRFQSINVPILRNNEELVLRIGETVRLTIETGYRDPAGWWDFLDAQLVADKSTGLEDLLERIGRILDCRIEIEVPIVAKGSVIEW